MISMDKLRKLCIFIIMHSMRLVQCSYHSLSILSFNSMKNPKIYVVHLIFKSYHALTNGTVRYVPLCTYNRYALIRSA